MVDDVVVGHGSIRFDRPVLSWFTHHREPWLTAAMRVIAGLGSSAVLIPLVLLVGAWYHRRHRRSRPLALLPVCYVGAFLLANLIKAVVGRAGPPAGLSVAHISGYTFPSGHATQAAAVYGMLAAILASERPRWRHKVAAWAGAGLVVTVVGITRLYLGDHWLSDVIGGWSLGTLWFLLVLAVSRALGARRGTPLTSDARRPATQLGAGPPAPASFTAPAAPNGSESVPDEQIVGEPRAG
jgi:undecaprenyl-diphosphatase